MGDAGVMVAMLAAAIVALAMLSLAALKGWGGWLELRRMELSEGRAGHVRPSPAAARLELADLKERVKRLEAIADGADDL